jgi:hypothetical protein
VGVYNLHDESEIMTFYNITNGTGNLSIVQDPFSALVWVNNISAHWFGNMMIAASFFIIFLISTYYTRDWRVALMVSTFVNFWVSVLMAILMLIAVEIVIMMLILLVVSAVVSNK